MIRSLRSRLTVAVTGVLVVVLTIFSVGLFALFARALWRQFDGRLVGDAAAVAGMVEEESTDPPWQFEYSALPEFERATRPAYFQVWLDDGSVLARSSSLGGADLPRPTAIGAASPVQDLVLPDGRPGRAIWIRQAARDDTGSGAAGGKGREPRRLITVAVARGTEDVRETLATTRGWFWGLTLLVLLGATAAVRIAVSRGLRPAQALAIEIARLDEGKLGRSVSIAGLPRELEPVVQKLNEVMARLGESFARERRFTADVSHELRTPLAALRTTLEVTSSRERSPDEYRRALDDASAVVRQMHRLVENLLMLARLDAQQVEIRRQEVRLGDLVADCWRPLEERARGRGLAFSNQVPDAVTIIGDADMLRLVLGNLLANAVDYTAAGGAVVVRPGNGEALFEVCDSGPHIPDELLSSIFDRFTRADSSRSGGLHCGIGLALVRSVCEVLALSVSSHNCPDGSVCFRIARIP